MRLSGIIKKIFTAGNYDYEASDEKTFKSIKENKEPAPILLVAESWEPPDAALFHFLTQLRKIIKVDQPIIIGLINNNIEVGLEAI